MRTTVTLDPDTEQLVRKRMKDRGVSFKRALNDSLRASRSSSEGAEPYRFETRTYDMGEPLIDLTKALQLAGELEDAEILAKMRRGS
jgi:hypothetical protein